MGHILDTMAEFMIFMAGFFVLWAFAGLLVLMVKAIVDEFGDDEVLPPPSNQCKRDYADKSWIRDRGK